MAMRTLALVLCTMACQDYLAKAVRRVSNKGMGVQATVQKFGKISSLEEFSTENGTDNHSLVKQLTEELIKTRTELETAIRQRDDAVGRAEEETLDEDEQESMEEEDDDTFDKDEQEAVDEQDESNENEAESVDEDDTVGKEANSLMLSNFWGQLVSFQGTPTGNSTAGPMPREIPAHVKPKAIVNEQVQLSAVTGSYKVTGWMFTMKQFKTYVKEMIRAMTDTLLVGKNNSRFTAFQQSQLFYLARWLASPEGLRKLGVSEKAAVYVEAKPTEGWLPVSWASHLALESTAFDLYADLGSGGKLKPVPATTEGNEALLHVSKTFLKNKFEVKMKGSCDETCQSVWNYFKENDIKVWVGCTGPTAKREEYAEAVEKMLKDKTEIKDAEEKQFVFSPVSQKTEGQNEAQATAAFFKATGTKYVVWGMGGTTSQIVKMQGTTIMGEIGLSIAGVALSKMRADDFAKTVKSKKYCKWDGKPACVPE